MHHGVAEGWDLPCLKSALVKILRCRLVFVNEGALVVDSVIGCGCLSSNLFDRTRCKGFAASFDGATHVDKSPLEERLVFEDFAVFKTVVVCWRCAKDDFTYQARLI